PGSWDSGTGNVRPANPTRAAYSAPVPPRLRFSSKFYLIAMLFVIFDVEAVFIFSWAIAFDDLGWVGYWAVLVFIILLLLVLVYEWRNGALDFGPNGKKILRAYKKIKKE